MFRRAAIAIATCITSAFVCAPVAAADVDRKRACVDASEHAQSEKRAGHFLSARGDLVFCAQDQCPAVVKQDCQKWLAEIDDATPTVALGARTEDGHDLVAAHFALDGVELGQDARGKMIPLDPGVHKVRAAEGGRVVESDVIARAGEKNRAVTLIFPALVPAPPKLAPPEPEPAKRATSPWPYVLGGVGVAAAGAFTYFAVTGINDRSDLNGTCAPRCSSGDVDAIRTKFLIADVAGVVSVVSFGAAAWLWLAAPNASPAKVNVGVVPLPSGAAISFGGRL